MSLINFTKKPELTTAIETITPAMAAEYLLKNTRNRRVTQSRVNRLAVEMTSGCWRINGDSIRFDSNGDLLDGQHRLMAVTVAGVPITTMVIRGLDPEVFSTVDTGKQRCGADALSIIGVSNGSWVAGALRMVSSSRLRKDWNGASHSKTNPTNAQILALYHEHEEIVLSVERMQKNDTREVRKLLTPTAAVFAHYWFSTIDADDAETFFQMLEYRANMDKDHPMMLLHKKLTLLQNREHGGKSRESKTVALALCFKTWNALRDKKQIKVLSYNQGQKFPTPH